jgi:hypothetical protein
MDMLVPPSAVSIRPGSITNCTSDTKQEIWCDAYNAKPAVTLTWYMNGDPIIECDARMSDDENTDENRRASANTSCLLTIIPTRADQARVYECRATGKALPTAISTRTKLDVQCTLLRAAFLGTTQHTYAHTYTSM